MPSKDQHQLQALKNEQFFDSFNLDDTPYLDWAVASLFYSALHLVEAYLATSQTTIGKQSPDPGGGHHAGNHPERRKKIMQDPALAPISKDYRELRQRCDNARYDLLPLPSHVVSDLFSNQFTKIRKHVRALL